MSRLDVKTKSRAQEIVDRMRRTLDRRIESCPPGLCPVDLTRNFLNLCYAQICGKCSPCRVGLGQLSTLLDEVLDGDPGIEILDTIAETAKTIADTADCAIGIDAARLVTTALNGFREDFEEHILRKRCLCGTQTPVPCVAGCPAGTDIPGYVALLREGREADAVRLIRKDNPFPSACAYICEHPCEARCRRGLVDAPVNIRALKRRAVDVAGNVPQPACAPKTGKSVGVVGGGPGGLTAAYYLALMGHDVTVYDRRNRLGGMLRYGIPNYRLPKTLLDAEIESILSVGIKVRRNFDVGKDMSFDELRRSHDAIFLAIGAHTYKSLGIEGEDAKGVMSAVTMLRAIGDGDAPDFTGKRVVVVGGGNVAMDVTRSAVRLGASKVTCVYRRRKIDMTALPEEVEGAIAEGAEVRELLAPVRVEKDENGRAVALWVQPQIVGEHDAGGRPRPNKADQPEIRVEADVVAVAIGQAIDSTGLKEAGVEVDRRGTLKADGTGRVPHLDGVFAGGDCVSGPATVIRVIEAGKVAAANIDAYLGFNRPISVDVDVPAPKFADIKPCGRVNPVEREACDRKNDFDLMEICLTRQEAEQEASRCLRCDCFGYGNFRGGREERW